MSDLIDRKLAKDAIHKKLDGSSFDGDLWHVADDIDDILDELPSDCNENKQQATVSSDCISRQSAIDVEGLDEQIRCEMCRNPMHTNRGCDGNCKYDEKLYKRIMQILGERIKPLPSAEPNRASCKQVTGKLGSINRQDAIDAINAYLCLSAVSRTIQNMTSIQEILENLPSAEPEHLVKESGDLVKDLVNDCINRHDAVKTMYDLCEDIDRESLHIDVVVDALENLPSAEPRKKGKWIEIKYTFHHKCSNCEWINNADSGYNFCPNCGSYNGGEEN